MGNLCGKSSRDESHFSTPGRTLDSAPPPSNSNARASVPNRAKATYTATPGRTVGGASGGDESAADPRGAAAKAAEARAAQAQGGKGGKLSSQLAAQKKQTGRETLEQASKDVRGARDQDEGHDARAWN